MSKNNRKNIEDEAADFLDSVMKDFTYDEEAAAAKLPSTIDTSSILRVELKFIPCEDIVEYQLEGNNDFREWPPERFLQLVQSVKELGVLEPVIVRPIAGNKYEMLAGHHRLRASREAGKETIPARIMYNCSDQTAKAIFGVTNILRRENSIKDKINGWWYYRQLTHYLRDADLDRLVSEKVISEAVREEAKKNERQINRYVNMHNLIDPLIDLADAKKLNTKVGEVLSSLTKEQQSKLLSYKDFLNDYGKALRLKALADTPDWDDDHIRKILTGTSLKDTRSVLTKSSATLKAKIAQTVHSDRYGDLFAALDQAIDAFLAQHPDAKMPEKPKEPKPEKKSGKKGQATPDDQISPEDQDDVEDSSAE